MTEPWLHAPAIVAALAIAFGCRDDDRRPRVEPPPGSARVEPSLVPKLPRSRDGRVEARELDGAIGRGRTAGELISPLLARAALRGSVDDLVRALALSESWIVEAPGDRGAWQARVTALSRVHRFAAAREALVRVRELASDPADWQELEAVLDEATGQHVRAASYRADQARLYPSPRTLTHHAANLALAGKLDEAIAIVPRAAATVRDNPASLVSWLVVQWGRLYSRRGEHAAARRFYEDGHARQPLSVEAAVLLAESVHATGGDARPILAAALADNPQHPELLALADKRAEAAVAWEHHVKLLPEAYADHAARFFLGAGADPRRALALARGNAANRDTEEARALVIEAALAADQPAIACEVAPSLANAVRAHQFLAWRAFGACGRTADAAALGARLGI